MNILYKCWPEAESPQTQQDGAIVVRINGNVTDSKQVDRPREMRNLKLLNGCGVASQLLAKFSNGIVYSFVEGVNLDRTVTDWKVLSLVAKEMARYHQISYREVLSMEGVDMWPEDKVAHPFKYIQFHVDIFPTGFKDKETNDRFKNSLPTKEELQTELSFMRNHMEGLGVPLVMCHNDVWGRNVVYNKETETLRFIDYEDTGFSYAAFDMAYFFCAILGIPADYNKLPNKDFLDRFLKVYLDKLLELNPSISDDDRSQLAADLYSQIHKCILLVLLLFTGSSMVLDRLFPGQEDYMGFSILSYKEYLSRKEAYLKM